MRNLGDRRGVQPGTVAEADMGHRDQPGTLIDCSGETLGRDPAVGVERHVNDARAARFLSVPDLSVGRKFEVTGDDRVALSAEVERTGDGVDPGGGRGCHSDFVGVGAQNGREAEPHRLVLGHPYVPIRADGQPIVEVGGKGSADAVGQRRIGPAVEISLLTKQRKTTAQRFEVGHGQDCLCI